MAATVVVVAAAWASKSAPPARLPGPASRNLRCRPASRVDAVANRNVVLSRYPLLTRRQVVAQGDKRSMGENLLDRLGFTAFAFRGYNTTNLGRSGELLAHPAYGSVLERHLAEASQIASDVRQRHVDLVARVREGRETSLETYDEAIAMIVSVEMAQLEMLEQFFDVRLNRCADDFRLQPGRAVGPVRGRRVAGGRWAADSAVAGRRLHRAGRGRHAGRAVLARAAVERRRSQAAVPENQLRGARRDGHVGHPRAQHRAVDGPGRHARPLCRTDARRLSGARLPAQEPRPLAAHAHAARLAAQHSQPRGRVDAHHARRVHRNPCRPCFRW